MTPAQPPARVDDITPVAQDYLKVIWSATEWDASPITTTALAERFRTTRANVSETVQRLAGQGLVDYRPYRPVTLTPLGRTLALAMVRRHRLVECFLVDTLGYDWDEVHEEAERLEHAVSDTMISRIDELLGHPAADPHGDPIPSPDGAVRRPTDTIRLSEAQPGRYRVIRVSDADPALLARLLNCGIIPEAVVAVGAPTVPDSRGDDQRTGRHGADRTLVTGPDGDRLGTAECAVVRVRPVEPIRA